MEPSFRTFVSVELPFRLLPSRAVKTADVEANLQPPSSLSSSSSCPNATPAEARAVTAFVPPAATLKALQISAHSALRTGTVDADARAMYTTLDEDEEVDLDDAHEQRHDRLGREPSPSPGQKSKSRQRATATHSQHGEEGDTTGASAARVQALYHVGPVSRRWLSTHWESHSARSSRTTTASIQDRLWSYAGDPDDAAAKAAWEADRQRDVFPSVEPQLLQESYLRNDLLLRVTRRKRVRRWRDATTGDIVRQETLPWEDDEQRGGGQGGRSASASLLPRLETRVMGVVSRDMVLRRPADFSFAMVTSEEAARAPSVHHSDSFPPGRFLTHKTPFTVAYAPGKQANTSVLAHQEYLAHLGYGDPVQRALLAESGYSTRTKAHDASDGDGEPDGEGEETAAPARPGSGTDGGAADREGVSRDRLLATLYADPMADDAHFPPAQTEAQREQLRLVGSSVDGSSPETDPIEVTTLVALLAARPVWSMAALCEAMLRTGRCPVDFSNRRVIQALTYVVVQGPFNRLRIRLGYDPFKNAVVNVRYQEIATRVMRRSDLGVLVRDVARSPFVAQALQVIRHRHKAAQAAYCREHSDEYRSTMLETLCHMIEKGSLSSFKQIIDLLDDPEIATIVQSTPPRDELPRAQRLERHGWLASDAQYVRITTHVLIRVEYMLREEVLPLLRVYEGNTNPGAISGTTSHALPPPVSGAPSRPHADGDAEEDDDGESVGSGASTGSAGGSSVSGAASDDDDSDAPRSSMTSHTDEYEGVSTDQDDAFVD